MKYSKVCVECGSSDIIEKTTGSGIFKCQKCGMIQPNANLNKYLEKREGLVDEITKNITIKDKLICKNNKCNHKNDINSIEQVTLGEGFICKCKKCKKEFYDEEVKKYIDEISKLRTDFPLYYDMLIQISALEWTIIG